MTLADVLRDTADHGLQLFQICDHAPLDTASDEQLVTIRELADRLGIELEVGTRGTGERHLLHYLHIARTLGARLVRSMWTSGPDRPDRSEVERRLRAVLPVYESSSVTLALETYEQLTSMELVQVVAAVDSANLGICLDPANCVANLEYPADVVARCAPYVKNWHVKDFDFIRSPGWVGFQYTGVPIGTGRLDYDDIYTTIRPDLNAINQIIEFWLPWQGSPEATIQTEADWTGSTIDYIRSRHP